MNAPNAAVFTDSFFQGHSDFSLVLSLIKLKSIIVQEVSVRFLVAFCVHRLIKVLLLLTTILVLDDYLLI